MRSLLIAMMCMMAPLAMDAAVLVMPWDAVKVEMQSKAMELGELREDGMLVLRHDDVDVLKSLHDLLTGGR